MTRTRTFPHLLLYLALLCICSQSRKIISPLSVPHASPSFKIHNTSQMQDSGSCSYTVSIKTSCSSTSYTRDQISLSFGDAYGNQVYVPRLDNPSRKTFERCSTDTFTLYGPCTYQVCYVYLYRSGYDGWKPSYVSIYGYYTKAVTFYYNTFIPNNVWFGFNHCNAYKASAAMRK